MKQAITLLLLLTTALSGQITADIDADFQPTSFEGQCQKTQKLAIEDCGFEKLVLYLNNTDYYVQITSESMAYQSTQSADTMEFSVPGTASDYYITLAGPVPEEGEVVYLGADNYCQTGYFPPMILFDELFCEWQGFATVLPPTIDPETGLMNQRFSFSTNNCGAISNDGYGTTIVSIGDGEWVDFSFQIYSQAESGVGLGELVYNSGINSWDGPVNFQQSFSSVPVGEEQIVITSYHPSSYGKVTAKTNAAEYPKICDIEFQSLSWTIGAVENAINPIQVVIPNGISFKVEAVKSRFPDFRPLGFHTRSRKDKYGRVLSYFVETEEEAKRLIDSWRGRNENLEIK